MNCRNTSTPSTRRTWGWFKTGLIGAALALFGGNAQAQTIWNSGSLVFTNAGGVGTDNITSSTHLTRNTTFPLYNSVCESFPNTSCASNPCNTQWAYGTIANWSSLTYMNLFNLGGGCTPPGAGQTMVCHLIAENIYLQVAWNSWGAGGSGGFSYTRTTGPSGPPCPDPSAISPPTANYCSGNPGIVLTASGAITYAWSPAAGLSATTGTSVTASPTSTTTYTVTGTGIGGCTNSSSSTITVLGAAPVITSTTATPATICPGSTSQLAVTVQSPTFTYCVPPLSNGCSFPDQISQVTVAGISRASGCDNTSGANGYSYFSGGPSGTLVAGSTGNAYSVTTSGDLEGATLWIDFNNDGTFGAGEQIFNSFAGTNPATYSGSFTVPAGAVSGVTRLRVRCTYNGAPGTNPCGGTQITYGETEDYNVTITGGAAANTYAWTPSGSLSSSTIANPVATPGATQTYTVTVSKPTGCSAQGTATVTVAGPVDDGNACTLDACLNGVVTHTLQDADGDGICDNNDPCPNLPNLQNGDPCDDGNVCTINDVVAGCACAGTFQDTDNDGTCNANDGCPSDPNKIAPGTCGCGNPEPGTLCNDGDPNTVGDQITPGCVCLGQATDCLGVPLGTAVPGSPCDDNNVCTINDIYNPSCVCVGTFQDTDGDGTCNANDGCPNDANKIAPGICGCGTADTDGDGDGLANCIDPCPALANQVPGDPCNDANPCTINDVITAGCVCAGTPAPVTVAINASSNAYCLPGSGVTLTASGATTYTWAPAAGLSATTGSPVTATPAATTTYTLTGSNAAGCTDTETVTLTTGSTPTILSTTATPSLICPGSNSQLQVNTPTAAPYCIPPLSFGCSFPDQISQVTVAGIVRSSGCDNLSGSNGYSYFSGGPSGSLVAGSSGNSYSVTTSGDVEGATIWIDYNQNGTFEAPAEQLFNSYAATNPATYGGSFTVPVGAINGTTRLRVRCTYSGAPGTNACGGTQTTYGETEDYNVTITGGVSSGAYTYSWSPATFLSNTTTANPIATAVTTATTYTVTVTNAGGCSATGTATVNVETTDDDNDGTVNCNDGCPNDPNKIAPGQCGCGTPDTDTDGDLTADCNDGCISDPNKIEPGVCGCGTPDTDTDSDGTADCFDLCPTDPDKIVPGQCGCGAPDTDGDGDGISDCIDNCPGVAGVQGTPCNDGDVNTINDAINASCVCAGTVPNCALNTVLLDLVTDNDGGQTSWDVVNISTTNVVCSGSGYLNNQTITLDCCLPNGCYELRVFDSAGDGMANGPVGGYVLRSAGSGNKRIIDNNGDGIFTSTSTIANNQGFCVPIGGDVVIAAHCDKNNWLPNDVIQATVNPAVTGQFGVSNANSGYQFWFFNPDGGYSRRITQTHAAPGAVSGPPASQRAAFLRLSAVVTQPIPFYTNLNIRIRTQVAGVFSQFGPACRFRLDPPCLTTQLTTVADPVVSCGATGLTLSSQIYATAVAGANNYQFEFTKGAYLRRIAVATRNVSLSFTTNPLQNNNCYHVRVRISYDGGLTYCPFGPSCTITIGTALCGGDGGGGGSMTLEGDGVEGTTTSANLHVWPNPNDGQVVNISLTEFDQTVSNVMVDVTDVYGKLISTRNIAVEGGYLNTVLPFDHDLAPGLYLVNLTAGDKRYTERLVIQR